jgi:hypothetical protein
MEPEQFHSRSHLFTVRLWLDLLGDGRTEWRGKVQHVPSGEARYFRQWQTLLNFLGEMLMITPVEGGETEDTG